MEPRLDEPTAPVADSPRRTYSLRPLTEGDLDAVRAQAALAQNQAAMAAEAARNVETAWIAPARARVTVTRRRIVRGRTRCTAVVTPVRRHRSRRRCIPASRSTLRGDGEARA